MRAALLLVFLTATLVQPAPAQGAIDKPVTIYVAGTAGGGIDLYARLLARHFGRHISGNPTVTVQVMPGAGGIRAAAFLATQAPRDGTAITTFAGGPVLEPLIGGRTPGYSMNDFTWIGAITKDVSLCSFLGRVAIQDHRRRSPARDGGGRHRRGIGDRHLADHPQRGARYALQVVTGYLGSQETIMAVERGEAHGRCVFSLSALKTAKPDWLRDNKINLLLQIALKKSPELPNVPLVFDLIDKQEDRQMVALLAGPTDMARSFAGPPGMAAEKATLLRRAFDATMKDPQFLAEAGRMQADVAPTTGEQVQQIVARMYATPAPVVERVKKFFVR
jgi:hypothetical protein